LSGAIVESDETDSAAALIPDKPALDELREAAAECTACPLFRPEKRRGAIALGKRRLAGRAR
jgi:hypothetical protein